MNMQDDWTAMEEWRAKGHRHLDYGEFQEAPEALVQARDLCPDDPWALGLLAIASGHAGDWALMGDTARRILALEPAARAEAVRVGCWMLPTHPINPLRRAYREANYRSFLSFAEVLIDEASKDAECLVALCRILYGHQLLRVAETALVRAIAIGCEDSDLPAMLNDVQLSLCDFERHAVQESRRRHTIAQALEGGQPLDIDPYNLLCIGIDFAAFDQACGRRSAAILDEERRKGDIRPLAGQGAAKAAGARLSIAFLLPYSWSASVNMVLAPLIAALDRDRFQVSGFSLQVAPAPSEQETAYIASFDSFVSLEGLSPREAARRIHDVGIDIILDCSGHTRTTCLPILVHRPAPIQAHFMGYGTSVVASFCDYLITDQRYHGPVLQSLSSERFALLPETSWTYPRAAMPGEAVGRADFGLPEGDFLFCTFNHPGKIEPRIFSAWMRILGATHGSRLVLCHWNLPDAVENLQKAAARAGIAPGRLIFVPPIPHDRHLQRLGLMDLALDTLFVGGGVTSMDTLWAGLPLLSVTPGEAYLHTSRGALGALSLDGMIMPTLSAYVEKAVALCRNPAELLEIRSHIVEHSRCSAMFDAERYARDLERLLEVMWSRHEAGDPPASFHLLPVHPPEAGRLSAACRPNSCR